jgi:hypothetical protein
MADDAPNPPPSPADLADAGVEVGPAVDIEEAVPAHPEPIPFKQISALPKEPKTDVLIELGDGKKLRERLKKVEKRPVADGLPTGFNFTISNALSDAKGKVRQDKEGRDMIVPPELRHEVEFQGDRLARMSDDEINAEMKRARGVAAAIARDYFDGMERGEALFGDRI